MGHALGRRGLVALPASCSLSRERRDLQSPGLPQGPRARQRPQHGRGVTPRARATRIRGMPRPVRATTVTAPLAAGGAPAPRTELRLRDVEDARAIPPAPGHLGQPAHEWPAAQDPLVEGPALATQRFLSVTARPAACMLRKTDSRSGLVVIAFTYRGSGAGLLMLWATIKPPGRTRGSSLVR